MELIYKENGGIGVLQNPQLIDLSFLKKIKIILDVKTVGHIELNGSKKYTFEKGCCEIPVKDLTKGTNTLRFVDGVRFLHLQPIFITHYADKIQSQVATSLDVLKVLEDMRKDVDKLNTKIVEYNKLNLVDAVKKLNTLIELVMNLQNRVIDLEKNYDPTVI